MSHPLRFRWPATSVRFTPEMAKDLIGQRPRFWIGRKQLGRCAIVSARVVDNGAAIELTAEPDGGDHDGSEAWHVEPRRDD